MKKVLLSIAIVLTMGFCANAQHGTDGWFKSNDGGYSNRANDEIVLPTEHGNPYDQNGLVPVGSGLIILTALGAGYALARKRD